MPTTQTTTTTGWRDVADRLTAHQVAQLARREASHRDTAGGVDPAVAAMLLADAVEHAEANTRDRERFGHIPEPAAALDYLGHWEHNPDRGWYRCFEAWGWRVGPVFGYVAGEQRTDGTISAEAQFDTEGLMGSGLSADDTRQVAAALLDLAEKLDAVTAVEPPRQPDSA
jgi:hypothetical protein